jgi:uncharacterized membrane protein YebE (DUF533 family)
VLGGKGAKKLGKTALKAGAIAAVGGIAWKAWQTYQAQQQAPTVPAEQAPAALPEPAHDMLLVRAMIAAAYADGHIDAAEQTRIFDRVDRMRLAADDKATLFDELRRPLGLLQLVELTPRGEMAVEVYAASVVAADRSQPATTRYLAELANRLNLPEALVAAVHAEADIAT